MRKLDITGLVFGRWTALARDDEKPAKWVCKCECGTIKSVRGAALRSGESKSCGCLSAELARGREKTHGMSESREWAAWRAMKNRAHEYSSSNSHYYEDRGIGVCDEWAESFEKFYEDMGPCPEGCTLERIDNRLGYSPENCKWDTQSRQASNRRKTSANKSGRIGVYWRKDQEKWRVCIKVDKVKHNIGQFSSYEEACRACEAAEISLLGYTREGY